MIIPLSKGRVFSSGIVEVPYFQRLSAFELKGIVPRAGIYYKTIFTKCLRMLINILQVPDPTTQKSNGRFFPERKSLLLETWSRLQAKEHAKQRNNSL